MSLLLRRHRENIAYSWISFYIFINYIAVRYCPVYATYCLGRRTDGWPYLVAGWPEAYSMLSILQFKDESFIGRLSGFFNTWRRAAKSRPRLLNTFPEIFSRELAFHSHSWTARFFYLLNNTFLFQTASAVSRQNMFSLFQAFYQRDITSFPWGSSQCPVSDVLSRVSVPFRGFAHRLKVVLNIGAEILLACEPLYKSVRGQSTARIAYVNLQNLVTASNQVIAIIVLNGREDLYLRFWILIENRYHTCWRQWNASVSPMIVCQT